MGEGGGRYGERYMIVRMGMCDCDDGNDEDAGVESECDGDSDVGASGSLVAVAVAVADLIDEGFVELCGETNCWLGALLPHAASNLGFLQESEGTSAMRHHSKIAMHYCCYCYYCCCY